MLDHWWKRVRRLNGEETQRRPAGALDETGRRVAHLPSAIVGNGALLVTLSGRGEIERMFWPNVDFAQQLGELRLGLAVDGHVHWLDEEGFDHEQEYLEDVNALQTRARGHSLDVEILDFVDPEQPLLVRRLHVRETRDARIVCYIRPTLEGGGDHGGCYVDPASRAVVFYRRDRALAITLSPSGDARVGRIHRGAASEVFADCRDGRLSAMNVEYGVVDGALAAPLAGGEQTVLCAFAATPAEALRLLAGARSDGGQALLERRTGHDRERLADAVDAEVAESAGVKNLYRRSLLTFDLVADRATGGVIAAPEMDDHFLHSGGYGFVWGRDIAFILIGFLAAGRTDLARNALRWLIHAQSPEGLWLHRHWTSGALAPSWGLHQIDETGAILCAFDLAWRELQDDALDRELWPACRRAANFLVAFRDPETGLTLPSVDLWEEREGEHAYSAAAVAAGLRAAAKMAARHEPQLHATYDAGFRSISDAIERSLWDEQLGRYRRSLRVVRAGAPTIHSRPALPYPNRLGAGVDDVDATVDVALLGLAWPFAAVEPSSDRMRKTVAAIEKTLSLPGGGLLRYDGDRYAGGNSWVLAVLWLGLWYRLTGDRDGYLSCLDYAVRAQTKVGLLPEQVTQSGRPAWVVPLTWSHAMFVAATRPEIAVAPGYGTSASRVVAAS